MPFKCKSFFQNSFLLHKKVEKQKLSFKTDFYYNIKMKKSLFTMSVSYCTSKAGHICSAEVKELKIDLRECRKKINKLFAGLGSVLIVKNCDLGLESAALGLRPRAVLSRPQSQVFTIRTSQLANNIYISFL